MILKQGDRIRLLKMDDDPSPIPVGATGTVNFVNKMWDDMMQYGVKWDPPNEKRTLMIVIPKDEVEVL